MAVSVEVPSFGEEMAGGLVAEWYRADGALVGSGEVVCRVESSFVAYEVEASGEGTLRHQKPAGSIERPGTVLGVILAPGEAMPHGSSNPPAAERPALRSVMVADEPESGASADALTRVEPAASLAVSASDEPEPLPEFEEALIEARVVPFPRRFTPPPPEAWEEVPGDATDFAAALWSGEPEEKTQPLPEAGGSIPGLPLWDAEEAQPIAVEPQAAPEERFQRITREAAAEAQVLHASILLDTSEAARLVAISAREWRSEGPTPVVEDIVFRAIALALGDATGADGSGALLIAEAASDVSCAISTPAAKNLREAVAARERGGDAPFESASWQLVSLAAHGIVSCTPRLDGGRRVAFALGATNADGQAMLTLAFDSLAWSEGSAARLLARVRGLFEAPYAMLV